MTVGDEVGKWKWCTMNSGNLCGELAQGMGEAVGNDGDKKW